MKITDIFADPHTSLQYMERYINDGSPSGFSDIHRTSAKTDPFGDVPHYCLWSFKANDDMFDIYGKDTPRCCVRQDTFLIHPDMRYHRELHGVAIREDADWQVVPTASCRTVQMVDVKYDYIKLHYDGIIGRINRRLPRRKAINGPEMSHTILQAMTNKTLPASLAILHEVFAKIFRNPQVKNRDDHWSLIFRESTPRGITADRIAVLIPFFSLWSRDRRDSSHSPILGQLFEIWGEKAEEICTDGILCAIIDIYFCLVCSLGLQNELNAQNLLLGLDSTSTPVAIVMRDMMGIEKDLTIRRDLGLKTDFDASSYKVISRELDPAHYTIRHSFAFDFKLCHYVLKPLLEAGDTHGVWEFESKKQELTRLVMQWIDKLPDDYFPPGDDWFLHRKELLVEKKEFIRKPSPMLR